MLADSRTPQQLTTGELRFELARKSVIAAAVAIVALPLLTPWPPSLAAAFMFGSAMLLAAWAVRRAWRATAELRRRRP